MKSTEFEELLKASEKIKPTEKNVRLEDIDLNALTQTRQRVSNATVIRYAEEISDSVTFPRPKVWKITDASYTGSKLVLASGMHRIQAFRRLERPTVPVLIFEGTLDECITSAYGQNSDHGLMRSRDDVMNTIRMMRQRFGRDMSVRATSAACKVSRSAAGRFLKMIQAEEAKAVEEARKIDPPTDLLGGEIGGGAGAEKDETNKPPSVDGEPGKDPGPMDGTSAKPPKDTSTAIYHLCEWMPEYVRKIKSGGEKQAEEIFRKTKDWAANYGWLIFDRKWSVNACVALQRRIRSKDSIDTKIADLCVRSMMEPEGAYHVEIAGFKITVEAAEEE